MSETFWLLSGVLALLLMVGLAGLAGYWWGRHDRLLMHAPATPEPAVQNPPPDGEHAAEPAAAMPAASDAETRPETSSLAEEVAAFSYTVTHDLRAPLRVIDGFSRILKEDYGKQFDRMALDHLDRVLGAAARMNAMIDAMMALARLSTQPLSRELVDLSKMAQGIADDLRRQAPERQVDIQIAPGLMALGDPTLLRQVLDNLLSNAWKYSAQKDRAEIRFASEPGDTDGVTFVVSDNGAGFDMKAAQRLFGLFQRLHSASEFPGNGVGLASVQRIVRRHGGRIWAEAEPQRGARFLFTLGS